MIALAILLLLLSLAGTLYTLFAATVVGRFAAQPRPAPVPAEPVSLLKPLHGAEPRLSANLASFLDQRWDAPIEMVAGVQRADDPAIAIARGLPEGRVHLIVDPTPHGANAKIANLINMAPAARHDLIVQSDSDIAVPPAYLATIASALAEPGIGLVTCLYRGRGDAGGWSVLGAAMISYQFLPSVLVGRALGLAEPCMGSTVALRRATLERIGGFARFADVLADDHAIGAAVRGLGLRIAIPPIVVTHGCDETSLSALLRHELRWAATIRALDPMGHAGMIATFPVPFALLALPFAPLAGLAALAAGLAARFWLAERVDRLAGVASAPRWLLPPRDCLSFVVFMLSFCVRSVDWRGARLKMEGDGRIVPERSNSRL